MHQHITIFRWHITKKWENNKNLWHITKKQVCKSNESESVSMLYYELVFHHKWADAQFFMADVQFFGVDVQFFRADGQFFAAGLLRPIDYAFCCCWTTFTLEMMVLCHVYPLLSMCKLCLPLTEHVQTLYWACAEIIYIIYPVFRWFKFTLKPPYSIAIGKLRLAIWDTSFWTWSNLDTRDLETYPRTYSGHFWNMSIFVDSRAVWVLFRKWVVS